MSSYSGHLFAGEPVLKDLLSCVFVIVSNAKGMSG